MSQNKYVSGDASSLYCGNRLPIGNKFLKLDSMMQQACQLEPSEDRSQRSGGIERIQCMHGLQDVIKRFRIVGPFFQIST